MSPVPEARPNRGEVCNYTRPAGRERVTNKTMGRSPWAWQPPTDTVVVSPPTKPLDVHIAIPGSKSFTNRALLIAALADGSSKLQGVLRSDDSYWAMDVLRTLGVGVAETDGEAGETVVVDGVGGLWPSREGTLYVGSAGTLARFLPGALAAAPEGHGEWTVDGSDQLRSRPVAPLIAALQHLGVDIEGMKDAALPLRVRAGLAGGTVSIPGDVSSQYTSGVLMAAAYARHTVTVRVMGDVVQPDYIRITTALMRAFGADVTEADVSPDDEADVGMVFTVNPRPYAGQEYTLEADASTACYFLALAALTAGRVRVTNVGYDSLQPDARFVDVLQRMGCVVHKGSAWLEVQGPKQLRGGVTVNMRPMSDQALTLGALAAFADGPVEVTGVPHIRHHESDRIHVFCTQMARLGIRTEERHDGFVVYPGAPRPGIVIDPHDDHRHAMAFSLLGTKVPGIRISDPGCVSKTCPTYFELLRGLGVGVSYE